MPRKTPTPQEALLLEIQRQEAKRHFLPFCRFMDRKYPIQALHLQLLADRLEKVYQYVATGGKEGIGRLMVFMPPRYWKSRSVSQLFPPWALGKNHDLRFILTSYGADLASKHSKEARDIIVSKRYQGVFGALSSIQEPVVLDSDSKASAAWDLQDFNGGMLATGVGGSVTGFGANIFIIDDPFKNRDEASSRAQRERVIEFYRSVVYFRLEDVGSAIVIPMTRWDQEDIAGELLRLMVSDPEADQWDVLFLPAVALDEKDYPQTDEQFNENLLRGIYIPKDGDQLERKPGEPLWAQKHDAQRLRKIRANSLDFEFVSQWQQMPRLAVGEFLDDDDFKIAEKVPDGIKWYWPSDLALGESETSDYNITGAIGMKGEDLYIRDVIKIRDIDEFLPEVRSIMLSDKEHHYPFGIESVAFQKMVLKDFRKDPALVDVEMIEIQVAGKGDKVERARAWRRRAKQGHVFLVRGRWNTEFIRVATSFPKGRHDDGVDFVSNGVQMIAGEGGDQKTASSKPVIVEAESLFSDASTMFGASQSSVISFQ